MASVPLPPRRNDGAAPKTAEIAPAAAPAAVPAQAAPALRQEGPIDLLGGLGDDVMEFLQGLFGQAFGGPGAGERQYPGYQWDALNGWVPDGTGGKPAAPTAPAAGGAGGPKPQNFRNYVGEQGL